MEMITARKKPFFLTMLQEGEAQGLFSPTFLTKNSTMLTDMSLQIAAKYFSTVYADKLKKACEVTLGLCDLGLLSLCKNDSELAKTILLEKSVVYCFRAGWAEYAALQALSGKNDNFPLSLYALAINSERNLVDMHAQNMHQASVRQLHQLLGKKHGQGATLFFMEMPEIEAGIQRYLNTEVLLHFLGRSEGIFGQQAHQALLQSFNSTETPVALMQLETSIRTVSAHYSTAQRATLAQGNVLDFTELRQLFTHKSTKHLPLAGLVELPCELELSLSGAYYA
jgi:hypothetical protein